MVSIYIDMNSVGDHVNLAEIREAIHGVWRTDDKTPDSRFAVEFIRSQCRAWNLDNIPNIDIKEIRYFDASR